jgi:hypothetical protein
MPNFEMASRFLKSPLVQLSKRDQTHVVKRAQDRQVSFNGDPTASNDADSKGLLGTVIHQGDYNT